MMGTPNQRPEQADRRRDPPESSNRWQEYVPECRMVLLDHEDPPWKD